MSSWTNQFDRGGVGEVLIQGDAAIDSNGNLFATGGFGRVATLDIVTLTNTGGQSSPFGRESSLTTTDSAGDSPAPVGNLPTGMSEANVSR